MTIGRKIIGAYALVLALLVLVAAVALYSLQSVEKSYSGFLDVEMQGVIGAEKLGQETEIRSRNTVDCSCIPPSTPAC